MATIKPESDPLTLLRQSHARIYRIALALCDDRQSAEAVVDKVLRMSGKISSRWETDEDAQRWFMHYTVLLCRATNNENTDTGSPPRRRTGPGEPPGSSAILRTGVAETQDPAGMAILRAIRQLPTQQREAFLLHHGEEMDLRQIATAMDCSSAAAANHLVAAAKSLKELQLTGIGEFTARLPGMLRQLVPPPEALDRHLQLAVSNQRRRRWIWRIIDWLTLAFLVAGMLLVVWWMWKRVEFL